MYDAIFALLVLQCHTGRDRIDIPPHMLFPVLTFIHQENQASKPKRVDQAYRAMLRR